jgi:hypothetical protein
VEVTGEFRLDPMTKQIAIDLTADGKKNSALEKTLAELGKQTSLFSGVAKKGGDIVAQAHVVLPADLKTAFNEAIDEAIKAGLAKETNEKRKEFDTKFYEALKPTLFSGDFDLISAVRTHKNGQLTAVIAGKVQKGAELEQKLRELYKERPATEQAEIKLDVAKAGSVSIHQVNIQKYPDPKLQKALGDGPLYFAVGANAVYAAVGKDALGALKEAIEAPAAPGAKAAQFEINLGTLALLYAETDAQKTAAKKAFTTDPGLIRLTVEGGQKLHIHFNANISVLEFIVAATQKAQEARFPGGGE